MTERKYIKIKIRRISRSFTLKYSFAPVQELV